MLYTKFVLAVMSLVEFTTISLSCITHRYSIAYAILAPLFVNAYMLLLLGVIFMVHRVLIPKFMYNSNFIYYRSSKREIRFYEKLGIKRWKDKIPELGKVSGFSKSHIQSTDTSYLKKFITETCYGEMLHMLSAVLGFTVLLFFDASDYHFVFPIIIANLILHTLPCLVQRYNRYRLTQLYKLKCKRSELALLDQQEVVQDETHEKL